MKYPSVLIFTTNEHEYTELIAWHTRNQTDLNCTVHISSNPEDLSRMFNLKYHVLVSLPFQDFIGDMLAEPREVRRFLINQYICDRMRNQWIECNPLELTPEDFSNRVNNCYIHYLINPIRERTRPIFSAFTTTYNTGDKIYRAYNSMLKQTLRDWEWVIMDDSPDNGNFEFLKSVLHDPRIRLYRRSENSGSIGNVKNEAASLCRGKYVLELDHDDEIMPTLFEEAAEIMDKDEAVGFVYSDFYNIYEPKSALTSGENFKYSDFISFGYGGYYCIYVPEDKCWRYVYITPNVNNITTSALISLPNHPRIWRKSVLDRAGNYSEYLPICDDMEILIRTLALLDPNPETESPNPNPIKIAKIHKPLYVQYMNEGGNNFSLIRNGEINRLGPKYLYPLMYEQFKIHDMFDRLNEAENPDFLSNHSQIWKRDEPKYEHKYVNSIVNRDVDKQLCILGLRTILERAPGVGPEEHNKHIHKLRSLPNTTNIIVLERERTPEELCFQLEVLGLQRARAYAMEDCTWEDLERFAERLMSIHGVEMSIMGPPTQSLSLPNIQNKNVIYSSRHEVINHYLINNLTRCKYLEIGVEWGHTYRNVIADAANKTGVDPSPKWDDGTIIRKTSDDFFFALSPETQYDVVFIDGMHHAENVWRDLRNALLHLSPGGVILIDDVLPQTYEEQWRVPRKHVKEDGVLKYGGSPWVGDVWKAIYAFLDVVNPDVDKYEVYTHPTNFRGILALIPGENKSEWISKMSLEVPEYAYVLDYNSDYSNYVSMLYRDRDNEV